MPLAGCRVLGALKREADLLCFLAACGASEAKLGLVSLTSNPQSPSRSAKGAKRWSWPLMFSQKISRHCLGRLRSDRVILYLGSQCWAFKEHSNSYMFKEKTKCIMNISRSPIIRYSFVHDDIEDMLCCARGATCSLGFVLFLLTKRLQAAFCFFTKLLPLLCCPVWLTVSPSLCWQWETGAECCWVLLGVCKLWGPGLQHPNHSLMNTVFREGSKLRQISEQPL